MKIILFLCAAMACWAPSLASAHGHGFYGGYRGFSSSPSFYGNYSSSGSSYVAGSGYGVMNYSNYGAYSTGYRGYSSSPGFSTYPGYSAGYTGYPIYSVPTPGYGTYVPSAIYGTSYPPAYGAPCW